MELYKKDGEKINSSKAFRFINEISSIQKILSKSCSVNKLVKENDCVRSELLVLFIFLTALFPIINHNNQKQIEKINKIQLTNKEKKAISKKFVSQLMSDVERTKYFYSKDGYSKEEFLFQNDKEIEADQELFCCLLSLLTAIHEADSIENLMNKIAQIVVTYSSKYPKLKYTISSERLKLKSTKPSDIKNVKRLNEIVKNWTTEQDDKIREVFLELFDLKIEKSLGDKILHDPQKSRDFDTFLASFKELDEMQMLMNLKRLTEKESTEMLDKLNALNLLDSFYKKESKRHKKELWG